MDVSAQGFWNSIVMSKDARVFNPLAERLVAIERTRMRRNVHVKNVLGMLNTYFTSLVFSVMHIYIYIYGTIAIVFTEDWLHCLLIRCINRTIKQFIGFTVL